MARAPDTLIPILSRQKRKKSKITKDQEAQLETLFFMDGITSYAASKQIGISRETAKEYFESWAADLVDGDGYETWGERQKRVRARALEGISKRIIELSTRKTTLGTIYNRMIYRQKLKKKDPVQILPTGNIDHETVLQYEVRILALDGKLIELQAEYDSIEAAPPAETILRQEILKLADELDSSL